LLGICSSSGNTQTIASPFDIDAVGHRIVHGGPHFEDPVVITPEVRQAIASASAFAPLHTDVEAAFAAMDFTALIIGTAQSAPPSS